MPFGFERRFRGGSLTVAQHRAAIGAGGCANFREKVEVLPNGLRGHAELAGELIDLHAALLAQQAQDSFATLARVPLVRFPHESLRMP
jgi:hypothetical protein